MFNNAGYGIPLVADINGNNNNGWGDGGGWWAWILFALLFGWGGNGWGGWGNNGNGTNAVEATVQRGFDTNNIINGIRGLERGLCDVGYASLQQTNETQRAIMQGNFGLQGEINGVNVALMQQGNALSRQLGDCCCENRMAVAQTQNMLERGTCDIVTAIKDASNAQMLNCNNNYRQLHDELVAMRMEDKNELIAQLRQQLNDCSRDSALAKNAQYIIDQVNPCSKPSYITCNPNTGYVFPPSANWPRRGYGYNDCDCNDGYYYR